MNNRIFTEKFWIDQWNSIKQKSNTKADDTYSVHKGFSTPEYWDQASATYDTKNNEIAGRKTQKTINLLKTKKLIFENCNVLEIGCGTGMLARELAESNCNVTAIDFSQGMIDRCKKELSSNIESKIVFLKKDWNKIDLTKEGWDKNFDLVIAFMSPAISTPESFFKMMQTTNNGCAIRGWAKKRKHDILDNLWERIMKSPLIDKPQNFLYKLNLLFSMGYFPELTFDKIQWEEKTNIEDEFEKQFAFFKKTSNIDGPELIKTIKTYLNSIANNGTIIKKHEGLTATALWHLKPDFHNKELS
jgi:SAM-dependent methyltransferase